MTRPAGLPRPARHPRPASFHRRLAGILLGPPFLWLSANREREERAAGEGAPRKKERERDRARLLERKRDLAIQRLVLTMRLHERLTRPFQAPASIRRYPNSQVALFANGPSDSEESSEEELDVMELRARGRESQRSNAGRNTVRDVMLVEREVAEDDSLNKLALQYGCQVADIKRINNFIREQDLYALKSIKIPVKVNGILTETNETSLAPQSSGLLPMELPGSPGAESISADDKQIDQYFRGIDQNIEQAAQAEAYFSSDYRIETPNWSPLEPKKHSSGADCGIQWWNAVIVMLLVGIVLPVFYIVYFKTQVSEVTAYASNTTVSVNDSSRVSGTGVSVSVSGAYPPSASHAPKTKVVILSGE